MVIRSSLLQNLAIAFILLVLGLGNISIGTARLKDARPLPHEDSPPSHSYDSLLLQEDSTPLSPNKKSERLEQLEKKVEKRNAFYRTVIKGGQFFLLLGGAWFLFAIASFVTQRVRECWKDEKKTLNEA